MSRAMDDEEVITELKKMVAFIRQEAVEKAREIQVKADEEFAIEKARIVRQESMNLDAQFEKKKKQVEVSQKIAKSNQSNKARLEILKTREENLQNLFSDVQEKLSELSKDANSYKQLLENLLLEGLFNLHEPTVECIVHSTDVQTVQGVVDAALKRYKEVTGRETKVEVKEGLGKDAYVQETYGSAGGLLLKAQNGKITLDNTLEQRLRLLEEQILPELRFDLLGPNEHRKYVLASTN
ncbi:V-ATPase V1 sector subunit E [Malassezia equina]|uniref:V-ATPase V1 sector subunit E n=1 Tax=Malassezia equina TaxID=1381935 RepID=A0AAF0ECM8_9BASI|nr:V-ATPase V1 sector subunit E [Malassezia equina]